APAPAPQPAQGAPAAQGGGQGAAQVRQMWPDVLEAVKGRRRFTWILLSQNAHVAGFDGGTLQLGFSNQGARDSFVNGGSEEVLRAALADAFGVQWRIETVVDPSGGAGSGAAAPGRTPRPAHRAPGGEAPAEGGEAGPPAPTHVAPEDDVPAEDDPDLDETALSGHELIVRELGATVLEEMYHE
ncbi:DNA polymerase III subunit gamma and tau, partial [Streptomyces sp. URMC 125]